MPDFIAPTSLETIAALVKDLDHATKALSEALKQGRSDVAPTQNPGPGSISPQDFVERVLALDEQISRLRLLLPLATAGVAINEAGRSLTLADLLVETRSEFDALARAQLELLLDGATD